MLLYGATGCGKSLVLEAMSAVAEESSQGNVQVIRLNSGEVYSKFLGETEQKLAAIFERAYNHYPHPTLCSLRTSTTCAPSRRAVI